MTQKTFSLSLTLEQAETALTIIESDITHAEFDAPDYNNVDDLLYALRRAELAERLRNAINKKGA